MHDAPLRPKTGILSAPGPSRLPSNCARCCSCSPLAAPAASCLQLGPLPAAAPPLLLLCPCTLLTAAGPSLLCGAGRGIRRLMWWKGPHWTWQTRPPSGGKRPHARQHPAAARRAGKNGHTVIGASMGVHGSRAARAALMLYCFCTVQGEHRRLKAETWGRVSAFSIHSSIFTLPPPHYPLWSHPSFRAFAAEYEASGRALHLLVNNAGALTFSKSHNQQGVAELCQVWP